MLRIRNTLALLVVLATAPACDSDDIAADEMSVDPLDKADLDDDSGTNALLLGCSLEPACDAVLLPGDEDEQGGDLRPQTAYDGDGLCILTALTAPDPSLVQTVMNFEGSIANLDFAIVGPGQALRQSYGVTEGVGEWVNPPMLCDLQGRDFFEDCKIAFDPSCLDPEAWVIGCEPIDELICPISKGETPDPPE